jgi:type II secretory pathway pseudopilin PulG
MLDTEKRRKREAGITLVEMIFTIGIFAVITIAAFNHIGISWSFTRVNQDRIFAFRRAQFILSELQTYVDRGDEQNAADLDRFDDGTATSPVLTITEVNGGLVTPDHPSSMNNKDAEGRWIWTRRITVKPFPGQNTRDVRFVTVRMFKKNKAGREAQLAEISSVVRSVAKAYPTTQVYDVYLLALENVPGWWVYLDSIRPFVEATLGDLEARNPGLKFNTHWITKLGYGRDPFYAPYMNELDDSSADIPGVYFYPGRMPAGSSAERYYVPTDVKAMKNLDGEIYNDLAETPFPYSLADQWNHCMRLPEAKELFQQRLAVGLEDRLTPTWQILLNDLYMYPDKYHNAIFINLHGELLPLPPLRNYSDAARDPVNRPGVRVVTHPEQLRYDTAGTKDVKLRVYAYRAPNTGGSAAVKTVTVNTLLTDVNDAYQPNIGTPLGGRMVAALKDLNAADAWLQKSPPDFPAAVGSLQRAAKEVNAAVTGKLLDPVTGQRILDDMAALEKALNAKQTSATVAITGTTNDQVDTITVRIGGLTLPDEATVLKELNHISPSARPVLVEKIGILTPGNPYTRYQSRPASLPASTTSTEMHTRQVRVENGELVITLGNTPLSCPRVSGGSGLPATWKLYGMDYIPSPVGPAGDFSRDLTSTVDGPKNTARWVITIRQDADPKKTYLPGGDQTLKITTAIGDRPGQSTPEIQNWATVQPRIFKNQLWKNLPYLNPFAKIWTFDRVWAPTGIRSKTIATPTYVQAPNNRSATYVYWTSDVETVPFTERYQFLGDPRHCPYADLREKGANFPNGFNWYFDDMADKNGGHAWRWGFTSGRLQDGWMGGLEIDVARFMQTLRSSLVRAETLYTTLTGWSYYYVGIGNEIGYDAANGFKKSIPVHGRPYGKEKTGTVHTDSISSGGDPDIRGVKLVRESGTATYWWGMPWLGELYPDAAHATWKAVGNLPAGDTAGTYKRVPREDITGNLPLGTTLVASRRRTGREGCTSFFNTGTPAMTFHHRGLSGKTGTLTVVGQELASNYHFSVPTTAKISRPFNIAIDQDGGVGPEFSYTKDFPRFTTRLLKTYYGHEVGGVVGSALVELAHPTEPRSAYIVVNGLDRTVESGSAFIAKYSMLSLIQSLMEAGDGSLPRPVARVPRLVIQYPTYTSEILNPTSIDVQWETRWTRWDTRSYTDLGTANAAEAESKLVYAVLYSRDGGRTWLHLLDDSPATPGARPEDPALLISDQQTGPETFTWLTPPADVPGGSYLIRIEAYRTGEELHFAHHMEKIYIERR